MSLASSGWVSSKASWTSAFTCSVRTSRSWRSKVSICQTTLSMANSRTALSSSSAGLWMFTSILGLPISSWMLWMKAQIFLISSWANRMAPSISSSVISWAPASTIMTASLVPATVRVRRLFSRSSTPGFRMYLPST